MATLLHHIQPWMQAEDQIEKRVAQQRERQIQVVHYHLDAFVLGIMAQPAPTIHLMTFQEALVSLREDMDGIHKMRDPSVIAHLWISWRTRCLLQCSLPPLHRLLLHVSMRRGTVLAVPVMMRILILGRRSR